jgi:V8-like Glu-specific endopeptidase
MKLLILIIISNIFITVGFAGVDSICGEKDEREFSFVSQVGRIKAANRPGSRCSATMISDRCLITAGHCTGHFETIEFNVPNSVNFKPTDSRLEDQYQIDPNSVVSAYVLNHARENDWAVMKTKKNIHTGKYPGQVQGYFNIINKSSLQVGDTLSITGYGISKVADRYFSQQSHQGPLKVVDAKSQLIKYLIHTTSATSGSSVVLMRTGEVVGIHTNGGCGQKNGKYTNYNLGVSLVHNVELRAAIRNCILPN